MTKTQAIASLPEPLNDAALERRQVDLQREADTVSADLDLFALLGRVGTPVQVGSVALGLMVWRDLDITVICDALDVDAVFGLGRELAAHPSVRQLQFRNDTGRWNRDAAYPDGLYWGIDYRTAGGDDWKVDIWFVDEPDRQPDLAHVESLPRRLTDETRRAILRIKDAWVRLPAYRSSVRSVDIYEAVLDHAVRTPREFQDHLEVRGR